MRWSGSGPFSKNATRLASLFTPPYYGRAYLARLNPRGYIAPSATIHHSNLRLGANTFIGDHVVIYQDEGGKEIELGERVRLHDYIFIQTGDGGSVKIGARTVIQPRCQFSGYVGSIKIGSRVAVAPNCAFYPYDHGTLPGVPIAQQPLQSKGDIIVEDDAWLGVGVIVLGGVRIGAGAVIGAGSVVTKDVPDGAIAVGVPARVIRVRSQVDQGEAEDNLTHSRLP